ncbi:MAG: hypothetical protein HYU53_10635 [Acidobacteria bacterium]|nr:hypothetical protein [Acidobacteriota bacterium]
MPVIDHLRRAAAWMPAPLRSRLAAWRYGQNVLPRGRADAPWTREGEWLKVRLEGARLRVPPSWGFRLEYHLRGNPGSREELEAFLHATKERPGGLLFDVGAEKGLYALLHCACDPANRAVLFEPSPSLHDEERVAGFALTAAGR